VVRQVPEEWAVTRAAAVGGSPESPASRGPNKGLMRAAVVHELGKAPRCDEFPQPVPRDDEVVVYVHAASLKPVDKQIASGSHYAAPRDMPFICGTDGVGHLRDGQRVFFGGCRPPYGAMAEQTVVPKAFVFPLPDDLNDELGAAIPNPGVSAWLSLT